MSAQLVVIGHLLSFYKVYGYKEDSGQFIIQNFGVVVFFILSGFLIAYSVNGKNPDYGFKEYFIDRASRIFIAFLPALVVIALLDFSSAALSGPTVYTENATVRNFFGNVAMLQDFPALKYTKQLLHTDVFSITSFGSGRPLWTVAIEWWMYLFFGFLLYKKFTVASFVLWGFFLIVPLFNMASRGNGLSLLWFSGVLVFYLMKSGFYPLPNKTWMLVFLFLSAAGVRLLFNGFEVYDLAFSLPVAFALLYVLLEMQRAPQRFAMFGKVGNLAKFIAGYSFSLYLLHYSVIVFIINLNLGINKWLEMAAGFILSNIIAYLFALLTEDKYPQLRRALKRKFLSKSVARQMAMQPEG